MSAPDSPRTERTPAKALAVVLTTGSLLAGLVAAFQLRDYIWPPARPTAGRPPASPSAGKTVLAGGAKVQLPAGWTLVDPEVVASRYPRAFEGRQRVPLEDQSFLEGPLDPGSEFAPYGSLLVTRGGSPGSPEEIADFERGREGCLLARVVDTPAGKAVHAVLENRAYSMTGSVSVAIMESYIWIKDGVVYSVMVTLPEAEHLAKSAMLRAMAESVELP